MKTFRLTSSDWLVAKNIKGSIQQRRSGGSTGVHSEQFKLLLKIYLPFAIRLAESIANMQNKALCYIDSYGNLRTYSEGVVDGKDTYRTEVQNTIKTQVYPKTPEGKQKTPDKSEKFYHSVPRRSVTPGITLDYEDEDEDSKKKKHNDNEE